jgi:hypothetical protein
VLQGFGDGGPQKVCAVVVEQSQQLGRLAGYGFAALKGGGEKALDLRDGMFESRGGGRSQGFAFEFDEVGDMNRVVYALMTVVAAPVASDLYQTIKIRTISCDATSVSGLPTSVCGIE